jgi:hypothetical protein
MVKSKSVTRELLEKEDIENILLIINYTNRFPDYPG